ncbi:potassium transporter TrkA [Thalassospira profundimaris]|uniref:Potassium transporter TrkA n=1 Tax=Thalassospira profundimaris TaxID=502049 RepID=A0A367W2B4_9PROT|nr:NAD(P)H-binding protein [Thalassospira profundimaris]RCK32282.1 potassium transporter TrkA [Thalassospira profundimaris]
MTNTAPHNRKIVVFGATGDVGREVVTEALLRGYQVTAVARDIAKLSALPDSVARQSIDILANPEIAAEVLAEHDVAASSLRPATGQERLLPEMTKVLLDAARQNRTPIFLTGGAATLKLADGSGHTVLTAPDFLPDSVRPIAEACEQVDILFDQYADVQWTCLRPPTMLIPGEKTRNYVRGTDTLVTDHDGAARISFADFGVAMVDLVDASFDAGISNPQRLTVGYQSQVAAA